MSRRLIVINTVLGLVATVAAVYAVRELRAPAPPVARRPAPAPPPAAAPAATGPATPVGSYGVVAARNLFSPSRSEAPPTTGPTAGGPQAPKPHLYGIILREGAPVAYLEDPATKRVAGYRLGDAVAGGTVKEIAKDHVVLNRPEGDVSVRLRDPSKPRPPAPPAAGVGPTVPGRILPPGVTQPSAPQAATPQPVTPGVPQPTPSAPPGPGQAVTPPPMVPGQIPVLPRRPLPPNLLRRLPPQPVPDAQPQN